MQNKKNAPLPRLKTWLLQKPVIFAVSFFISSAVLCLVYGAIQMAFNIETFKPVYALLILSFITSAYYTIKKLPHENMPQSDFIAITNGASLISIATTLLAMLSIGLCGPTLKQDIGMLYIFNPTIFTVFFLLLLLFSLYLVGVAICNIYAKYKRANTIGVQPWKIILSMPFAFLMMWTPGYLLKEKSSKTNLHIKSHWYGQLNKWVVSNFSNTLFMFLFLLLCKGIIAGTPTLILYVALLIIYTLWYVKHKSDFIKNINRGYALTAVGINIAILILIASTSTLLRI